MTKRYLVVSIDTEIDHDEEWRIADPPAFSSIVDGIPRLLAPLFKRHQVVPTYLLSPEVIEDPECIAVLRRLGSAAEMGTHLHLDFIEPDRRLFRHNMAGQRAAAIQAQCSLEVEMRKMENLTRAFSDAFGFQPRSFRAGRFGIGPHTLEILARLGYLVDSSVTPGLRWKYAEGLIDHRQWSQQPAWVYTAAGAILELPLSIRPASRLSPIIREIPLLPRRFVSTRLFERVAGYRWLRPSWNGGEDLIRYTEQSSEEILVLMFHSTEIIPGASPYAQLSEDVQRIIQSMDALFRYWRDAGHAFCSMIEAAEHVKRDGS